MARFSFTGKKEKSLLETRDSLLDVIVTLEDSLLESQRDGDMYKASFIVNALTEARAFSTSLEVIVNN